MSQKAHPMICFHAPGAQDRGPYPPLRQGHLRVSMTSQELWPENSIDDMVGPAIKAVRRTTRILFLFPLVSPKCLTLDLTAHRLPWIIHSLMNEPQTSSETVMVRDHLTSSIRSSHLDVSSRLCVSPQISTLPSTGLSDRIWVTLANLAVFSHRPEPRNRLGARLRL